MQLTYILQKYEPLKVYFRLMGNSTDELTKSKANTILTMLTNPVTEVFFELYFANNKIIWKISRINK